MADSMECNLKVQYLSLLVPPLFAFFPGLVIHSFIIGVNVNDWWKGRSVTPVDHIVMSLGISRIFSQSAQILDFFLVNLYSYLNLRIMHAVYCFFAYANIWLTSLLSIVLCLKISNLHTRLFLYLRRMILHRTGHFIAVSLLFSAFSSLIPLLVRFTEVTTVRTFNSTMDNQFMDCTYINAIYYVTLGDFFPLLFYSISSVLLFASLYHHTTRMKMSSNLSINLETYYSAMRLVLFNFAYNTLYFVVDFLCIISKYFYCVDFQFLFITLETLPALHSSYLIYRTAKLRNQMSKVLHNVIGFLFQRKDTEIQ